MVVSLIDCGQTVFGTVVMDFRVSGQRVAGGPNAAPAFARRLALDTVDLRADFMRGLDR
jgi:hypothetical protein